METDQIFEIISVAAMHPGLCAPLMVGGKYPILNDTQLKIVAIVTYIGVTRVRYRPEILNAETLALRIESKKELEIVEHDILEDRCSIVCDNGCQRYLIPGTLEYMKWPSFFNGETHTHMNASVKTTTQYSQVITECKDLFLKKTRDYGTAWRILRLSSITDQIWIKASRIRSIQEKGSQLVDDSIRDEFIGIINYCVIALIQQHLNGNFDLKVKFTEYVDSNTMIISPANIDVAYDAAITGNVDLLNAKNHDYGEAWREMRISSITDIILQKLLRIKQIENNNGMTIASEGVNANYQDILNYAVFSIIKINEMLL